MSTTGKVHTHWVNLRSHDDPTAEDVLAGEVTLGTDGSTVFMTTSDGVTTAINGSAVMKDITLDDDAADEFRVRQAGDTYLLVHTTDDAEVVKVGNDVVTGLTAQIQGNTLDFDATDDMTVDAGGTMDLVATGVVTVQGGALNLGGAGNGDILVGTTGTRDIDIGSINATDLTLNASGASIDLTSTGAVHLVPTDQTWTVGRTGVDHLVVDDNAGTVQALSTLLVTAADIQVTGDITCTGEVDGVDLSTLSSIANGEGCSQLGVEDAGGHYTGADVEAVLQELGTSVGLIPTNISDLTDVDTAGVADKNLLWFVNGDTEWQPVAAATVLAEGAVSDLSDVNAGAPADGEVLTWDDGGGEWVASASAITGGADSEFDSSALSTVGVYEVKSGLNQEILFDEGARIHVSFAATVVRTGTPAGELRVGFVLEDVGGTGTAYFATDEDLGGATNIELSGSLTLSLGPADSADGAERNIHVSGSCLRAIDGSTTHSSFRKYDDTGHAPVAFPGGLKFADLGEAFDHLRFYVLTNNNTHDGSNKYEVTVGSVTVDMFTGT